MEHIGSVNKGNFISSYNFHERENTLEKLLSYSHNRLYGENSMEIILRETDLYFIIEVRIDAYDGSLSRRNLPKSDEELVSDFSDHPLLKFASQACKEGNFAEIQSTDGDERQYGMNINVRKREVGFEYFDQEIQVDKNQTLYMIGFESNISEVWKTVRSFVKNKDNVSYHVISEDGQVVKVK